ncbi:hypothetical protein C1752_16054 [Acaryochloris thomasi RCC1774]|uniref:Uncharacterized protein n=1 Tax=Acaryochloris thomasi RCC1774 TaxID=1764569 RepID=A0A2W1JLR8_9CYAN|nr:hypothetical protein [Acaryochloris thomasi]PZD70231.1 hypothetical protein C1752_16054 [Acaryochloris thomasi RCC1774]
MSPSFLKTFWCIIEVSPAGDLLQFDDRHLAEWLCAQVEKRQFLNHDDRDMLRRYIQSHLLLIRDVADSHHSTAEPLMV